ncbi:Uncharacterised protein [Mycobacterium tuberculosis]|nr:Uncharacterised protein [Mycobacterium tuberculosis]
MIGHDRFIPRDSGHHGFLAPAPTGQQVIDNGAGQDDMIAIYRDFIDFHRSAKGSGPQVAQARFIPTIVVHHSKPAGQIRTEQELMLGRGMFSVSPGGREEDNILIIDTGLI